MSQVFASIVAILLAAGGAGCRTEQAAAAQVNPVTTTSQGNVSAAGPTANAAPLNGFDGMPPVGTKAKCPVQGDVFEVTKDTSFSVYEGKTYVFCCPGCKPQFDANPEKYIGR
jgi:YHS domain-containing protein